MEIPMLIKSRFKSAAQRQFEPLENRRLLSFSAAVTYPVGLTPVSAAAGDFNNDGHTDLAVANQGQSSVSVLLGNGDGSFQPPRTSGTTREPSSLVAGDLNGDGRSDLVYVDPSNGGVSVLLGNGDGLFQAPRRIGLPGQIPPGYTGGGNLSQTPRCAVFGDLNADGRLDVIAGGSTVYSVIIGYDGDTGVPIYEDHIDGYLNVLLGRGDGTFAPAIAYHTASDFNNMAVGDFDGNGKLDVLTDIGLTMFPGNGDGTLGAPRTSIFGDYAAVGGGSLPVADFNRDGKLDVVMRDSPGNAVVVMPGNGDGTFRETEPVLVWSIQTAAAGDVNADGKPDIVVLNSNYVDEEGNWASSAHVLLGRGDGTLAPPVISELGLLPDNYFTSAALADFDGDGYLDVAGSTINNFGITENNYPGAIAVSHNIGNWATKTWMGPGGAGSGGNWSTAAHWSPSGVPGVNDLVTISAKSVTLSSSATVANVNLTGGGALAVTANGSRVLRTSSLSVSSNSNLNLNDNDLIINYSDVSPIGSFSGAAYTGVSGQIAQGRNQGTWSGNGIRTGMPQATTLATTLGVAEASEVLGLSGNQTALWDGQTVDSTTVLVKYTYTGDANLDGKIDADDYAWIDYYSQSPASKTYNRGDFNYDGAINADDYAMVDLMAIEQDGPL
jgi:hypothetical protein